MASIYMRNQSVIAVFARRPEVGKVKTRLAQKLGTEAATSLYKAMLSDTLQTAQVACDSVLVCFTPDDAFRGPDSLDVFWSGTRLPQRGDNLGERMHGCIEDVLDSGARQVLVIGSDAPDVPGAALCSMLETLQSARSPLLCLGPAHDGGFYALGTNARLPKSLFQNVTWSTSSTLQQVSERAQQCGWPFNNEFPVWRDVDEIEDLIALSQRLYQTDNAESSAAPHTRAWLAGETQIKVLLD